jgi:hypothetical protein
MSTGVPMPNPRFRAFDANGNPLAAGKLYAYQSGTLVAQNTYSDQALTTPNANPSFSMPTARRRSLSLTARCIVSS